MPTPVEEGFLRHRGVNVRYRVAGDLKQPGRVPLLAVHGGPGAGLAVLQELEPLARDRPIVFYDQMGCAKSDRPKDPALYTLEFFVDELLAVREHFGLDELHLFAHCFGGKLALEWLLNRGAAGVVSLTLASAFASHPLFSHEFQRLLDEMPDVKEALASFDKKDPRYQAAWVRFQEKYYLRLAQPPSYFLEKSWTSRVDLANDDAWDVSDRLDEIGVPTLLTTGRHDVVTAVQAELIWERIQRCDWEVFEESSHFAFIEEPERYRQVLGEFLQRIETDRPKMVASEKQ